MNELSAKERLMRQARGGEIDRIPAIGGWIGGARNLAALAGITVDEYLRNPMRGVVLANKALGVDGMVSPVVPAEADQIRTGSVIEEHFAGIEPEALLKDAEAIPDEEKKVLASFDAAATEQRYRDHLTTAFRDWEGIQPIPNFWELGGPFPLYTKYGYEAFLMACALYPEAVRKIWWSRSLHARESAKIMAKLYGEYDLIPLLFCGEDVCNNKGPMVSPDFLRENYFPLVKMIIEPIVSVGVTPIHHCDGDVRPVVADFFSIGFGGLQGFQYELGVSPAEFRQLGRSMGKDVLFFAGMSVTRTLPFGTEDDVRREVDYLVDCTGGGRGMLLFTSNVTGVEVPPANIRAGYEHLRKCKPGRIRRPGTPKWHEAAPRQ